jgi:(R,R)-butanediol dehydrogenase/meso-butanediol dehydrogenase/diacetyl reductase
MAEFVPVWAEHCFPLPDSVNDEAASLLDILGVAAHAVNIAEIELGSSALVIGAGPLGLFISQCAALVGAKPIIVSELNPSALSLAEKYGADVCVNPKEADLSVTLRKATEIGAWTVFDTVGLPLRETMPLVASGGRLMLLAVKPEATSISPTILSGERRIQTVANFRYDDFPTAIEDLHDGRIRTDGMVTHKFRLSEAVEAFWTAEHKEQTGAIKVLLIP